MRRVPHRQGVLRYVVAPLSVLLLVVVAVGCSSSGGSDTTKGSGQQGGSSVPKPVCSSLASLKSSIRSLDHMKVNGPNVEQAKAKLTTFGTAVGKFLHTAESQYSKEVSAIRHDYESLKSAVDTAMKNPTYPTIAQVKTEFTTLAHGVNHFASSVAAGC